MACHSVKRVWLGLVPDLGLIRGRVLVVCRVARVQMPPECPECGGSKVAEIVCGYQSSDWDWEKDVDSGKVVLGGCCIPPDPHSWQCRSCDVTKTTRVAQRLGFVAGTAQYLQVARISLVPAK